MQARAQAQAQAQAQMPWLHPSPRRYARRTRCGRWIGRQHAQELVQVQVQAQVPTTCPCQTGHR